MAKDYKYVKDESGNIIKYEPKGFITESDVENDIALLETIAGLDDDVINKILELHGLRLPGKSIKDTAIFNKSKKQTELDKVKIAKVDKKK